MRPAVRRRLVWLTLAAAIGGSAAVAAPAVATIYDPGERVGKFKVLGGHFRQKAQYIASYETTPSAQDECWTYKFHDAGSGKFDLSFDKGDVSALRYDAGDIRFHPRLKVSGPVARKWSGTIDNTPGPGAGSGCPPAGFPPQESGGCGNKQVNGAATWFTLPLVKDGVFFSPGGHEVMLFGNILEEDPFAPCPSDSAYTSLAIPAVSPNGAEKLDSAKVGTTVKLDGKISVNGKDGMFIPFEEPVGSQQADVDWSLKLLRVKG
jgi:hypothetical protein